jgi:hypothetical protein
LACRPRGPTETRVVTPRRRSRTKTSPCQFVSPGTRFVASARKATYRPPAESDGGGHAVELACSPCELTDTRVIVPRRTSWTKTSTARFVSPGTRLVRPGRGAAPPIRDRDPSPGERGPAGVHPRRWTCPTGARGDVRWRGPRAESPRALSCVSSALTACQPSPSSRRPRTDSADGTHQSPRAGPWSAWAQPPGVGQKKGGARRGGRQPRRSLRPRPRAGRSGSAGAGCSTEDKSACWRRIGVSSRADLMDHALAGATAAARAGSGATRWPAASGPAAM